MEDLKFSVSMCVYGKDNAEWFSLAVESILNQTVLPTEIVLVVDGPIPEDLNEAVEYYEKNPLFHIIRLEKNQGHGNARRVGLSCCKNELVAIMDADDISLNDRFEKQLKIFSSDGDTDVVGGNICEFSGTTDNIAGKRLVPSFDKEIKKYMKQRCPMNQMTVMFKKSSVESAGGYLDWYCNEDYYLWVRMALAGMKFANVPEVLVNVRVGKETYQRRGGWKYFKSEAKLQKFMRKNGIIGVGRYLSNVIKRFIVQVLLPNKIRGWVFRKFARQ